MKERETLRIMTHKSKKSYEHMLYLMTREKVRSLRHIDHGEISEYIIEIEKRGDEMLIAAKFGGTSLATAEQILKVRDIVQSNGGRKHIVVSAPGARFDGDPKVTDLFKKACKERFSDPASLEAITARFREIIRGLKTAESEFDEHCINFDVYFENLWAMARENYYSDDFIISRGEYLSAVIIGELLKAHVVESAKGIKLHQNGDVDHEATSYNLLGQLQPRGLNVIPGFYGSDDRNTIRTLPRGGSDITGALVAEAVRADVYENWSDVNGILVADPRVVKNPKTMDVVTYGELQELAVNGASVLHHRAVTPVRRQGIPINVRNTNDPTHEGTRIVQQGLECSRENRPIVGISGRGGFRKLEIRKYGIDEEVGFVRKLYGVLEEFNMPIKRMVDGDDLVTVVWDAELVDVDEVKLREEINTKFEPDSLDITNSLALIAIVGPNKESNSDILKTALGALQKKNIERVFVSEPAQKITVSIGVSENDLKKSIRSIHKAFF